MLRSLKELEGYTATATDGHVGPVEDFYFDDDEWGVRYMVVAAGGLLGGRRVLILRSSLREPDWSHGRFPVALTVENIKGSPTVALDQPVSRQKEQEHLRYFGAPPYWGHLGPLGGRLSGDRLAAASATNDVHLRSAVEVRGYSIQGTDAAIGHVADFIVDDEGWVIRYLVVDVSHWWSGKMVLVAPHWARQIDWEERKVFVDLDRRTVEGGPPWDAAAPVNREYEARLFDYYGRPVYWDTLPPVAVTPSDEALLRVR